MPAIMQCFIKRPKGVKKGLDFDRKLYVARRVFEQSNEDTYVVSLSSRTIVYKGMFLVQDLRKFFPDLQEGLRVCYRYGTFKIFYQHKPKLAEGAS